MGDYQFVEKIKPRLAYYFY